MNNNQLKKNITTLQQVSLAPEDKGAIFNKLTRYAEKHQPVTDEHLYAALSKVFRSIFSTISWK